MLGWGPKSERKASDKLGENLGLWQIGVSGPGEENIFSLWHAILKMCSVLPINGCKKARSSFMPCQTRRTGLHTRTLSLVKCFEET